MDITLPDYVYIKVEPDEDGSFLIAGETLADFEEGNEVAQYKRVSEPSKVVVTKTLTR